MSVARCQMVACLCGRRLVPLTRMKAREALGRARGDAFALFGGVCDSCGRGIDLYIEKQPSSNVSVPV